MADCAICSKTVAVSLYVRVKPMVDAGPKLKGASPKDKHKFYGYWPKGSHLGQYLKMEVEREQQGRSDPILQNLWNNNCHGHSPEEIISSIEETMPPDPHAGIYLKMLWNPSPKVTPYLLSETNIERKENELHVSSDLRWTVARKKEEIRQRFYYLINNSADRLAQSISRPGQAVK